MAGQLWAQDDRGGYMFSEELSSVLRTYLQELCMFRQFCQVREDAVEKRLHKGDTYTWNVYSNVQTQGRRLTETNPIPETNFTITPTSMTVFEAGNSVPYTGFLEDMSEHDLVTLIDKTLKDDARKFFDIEAYLQFDETPIRVAAATSTTSVVKTTNGSTATTNGVELGTGHHKAIVDDMRESNVPPFVASDYICLSHPTTLRPMSDELESVHQYTQRGIDMVYNGEKGRYDGVRYCEQTHIPKGGAIDSTTFDPYTGTADDWNGGLSSWAFYFGDDTVAEAPVTPEEIRAKIPGDFGRDKGIAWYTEDAFGLVHTVASQARIFKWDSAA